MAGSVYLTGQIKVLRTFVLINYVLIQSSLETSRKFLTRYSHVARSLRKMANTAHPYNE
jgi:hypothetical protein